MITPLNYIQLSSLAYVDFNNSHIGLTVDLLIKNKQIPQDVLNQEQLAGLQDPTNPLLSYTLLSSLPNTTHGLAAAAFQAPPILNSDGTTTPGRIVFSFRGTELSPFDPDYATDAGIALALAGLPYQFIEALSFVNAITGGEYSNISFTGHSLGGAICQYLSLSTHAPSTTFNAVGIGQLPSIQNMDWTGMDTLITDHVNINDMIGNYGVQVGRTVLHTSTYGGISISDMIQAYKTVNDPAADVDSRLLAAQTLANGAATGVMSPADFIKGSIPLRNHELTSMLDNGQMTDEVIISAPGSGIAQLSNGYWDAADGGKFTTFTVGGVIGGIVYYGVDGL